MRILAIGDIHEPVSHPGYLRFCRDLRDRHRCDRVVFVGDVVDWHAISFHAKHPEAPGATDEYELALASVRRWRRAFESADVCIGNHDERIVRKAEEAGIPECFIRTYRELWHTPRWNWRHELTLDGTYFFHGTGSGGVHPAYNSAGKMLMSVCQGHIHSAAGIKWRASPRRRIFGMDTGCGIDDRAYAFAYGKHCKTRSILGAGVILDGIPYHEVMPIGPGERYHRSRFRRPRPRPCRR